MSKEKNIKDYLHLYIGCKIQYPDTDGSMIIAKLTGVSCGDGVETTYIEQQLPGKAIGDYLSWEPNGHHKSDALHLKPLLRPISDMTEEEATRIAIIMYGQPDSVKWRMEDKGNYFNVYRRHYVESFTIDKASGDIDRYEKWDGETEIQITLNHHFITHYLLSRGFDLFGLIEAGLAIDKTKL